MTGIYFLLDRKKIVYIGQSKNAHSRIGAHKDKQFDSVRIIICQKSKLNHYERRLVTLFNPKYNKALKPLNLKKHPIGKPIMVRLDKKEKRMLIRMCNRNQRTPWNQITFAIRQHYQRQFNKKQFNSEHF